MKDADVNNSRASSEEAERFQSCFYEQQKNLEKRLSAFDEIPKDVIEQRLAEISSDFQSLQRLYSASAPYLKIYDRKICQDSIQALQTKLQETEARLMPRKKFVFKGKKTRNNPKVETIKNGNVKREGKPVIDLDVPDGSDSCTYSNIADQVLILSASEVTGRAVLLSKLSNCSVQILGAPTTLHIAQISSCSISAGPVNSSVFVDVASNCQMQLACQQLRIHRTTDTDFRIHVTSKAIIEDCRQLRFGVYTFSYPTLEEDYLKAGLSRDVNNWNNVDDFDWLAAGQSSPNWSLIPSSAS